MEDRKKLKTGVIGAAIAAICCFTPALVVVFGIAGVSAWLGWIDYVLFPALFASLGLVAHALYLRAGKAGRRPDAIIIVAVAALTVLIFWLEFRFALRLSLAAAAFVAAYAFYLHRAGAPLDGQQTEQQS